MQLTQNGIFEDLKHYAAANKKSPSSKKFFENFFFGHKILVHFFERPINNKSSVIFS